MKSFFVVAGILSLAGTCFAEDKGQGTDQKDICLIYPEKCGSVDTIQQRIERLKREIAKGTAVYTQEELASLQTKLKDANTAWMYLTGDRPTN